MKRLLTIAAGGALLAGCAGGAKTPAPTDGAATAKTCALYGRLFDLSARGVMVGHQDDLAYGYQRREYGFSDVYDCTGDYPAVTGWEIGRVELGAAYSLDSVRFDDIRRGIAEVDARGGISTVSWHADNILTGGSTWDCGARVVAELLPGGAAHEEWLGRLDRVADFLGSLRDAEGRPIPVVLRLYHEQTASWFWWGAEWCSPEEYKALWRMTVEHLRGVRGVHNVLYAYSPTDVADEAAYLERYPGDEWVDVVGFDLYLFGSGEAAAARYTERMRRNLSIVTAYAARAGKVAVMAETGAEGLAAERYFSRIVAPLTEEYPVAWILFWRNAWEPDKPGHFYVPYKGHPSQADFEAWIASERILMNRVIR